MKLQVLENKLKVVKLNINEIIPDVIFKQGYYSITKTDEELSVVVDEEIDIKSDLVEHDFRAIKIIGTLDFSLIGIISRLSSILTEAKISIFVISTYNTDYILVRSDKIEEAKIILKQNGYEFI